MVHPRRSSFWHGAIGAFLLISLMLGAAAAAAPARIRTLSPSATGTPPACSAPNPVQNPGFESGSVDPWVIDGFQNPPVVTTDDPHSGTFSVQLGTISGPEPNGDSSLYQEISVPAGGGILGFWYAPSTTTGINFDYQDAYVMDTQGHILATIMHVAEQGLLWTHRTYDMASFAGQTVRIKFLVHEDGFGDDTFMFVDDVTLDTSVACTSPTPPPTGTPPTNTATATSTATPCTPYWSRQAPYPVPVEQAAVVAQGGVLYSFGGTSGSLLANAYKYAGNTWTAIAPLPAPRSAASAVSDGQFVYILNGWDSTTHASNTLYRYDPASDTYLQLPSPVYATALQGAAYLNGKIYRIAGCYSGCAYGSTVEAFDIAANTWGPVASYPQATFALMAVGANGSLYGLGGRFNSTPFFSNKTYRYDPASNAWSDAGIADLPQSWSNATAGMLNGQLIVAGGTGWGAGARRDVSAWDPLSDTWYPLTPLIEARIDPGGAALGGAFYVVGGAEIGPAIDNQRYLDPQCATATSTAVPPSATMTVGPGATALASPTPPLAGATATASPTPSPTLAPATASPAPSPTLAPATASPAPALPTSTATPGPPPATAAPTRTPALPTSTATPFAPSFTDVHPADYFYTPVMYLATHGVVSGYGDDSFRPYSSTTRSQLVKIVVLGFNIPLQAPTGGAYSFQDVPSSHPFFGYVETAAARNVVSGYTCGTVPAEPCVPPANRPYFRPYAAVTRGQLAKIVSSAAAWPPIAPTGPGMFADVLPGTAFYAFVETAYCHGIVSGYNCGGPGEPCDPQNRPYYRQYNNAVRGQIAKIVYGAITGAPACATDGAGQ